MPQPESESESLTSFGRPSVMGMTIFLWLVRNEAKIVVASLP
ncbi:MAG TPA: hypothetical protein VGN44_05800 [Candidatus Angelobacter sp.]